MTEFADSVDIVIGVDTHKHTHAASFVAPSGGAEDVIAVNSTKAGYMQLLTAAQRWPRRASAIEGTASYGVAARPCSRCSPARHRSPRRRE